MCEPKNFILRTVQNQLFVFGEYDWHTELFTAYHIPEW